MPFIFPALGWVKCWENVTCLRPPINSTTELQFKLRTRFRASVCSPQSLTHSEVSFSPLKSMTHKSCFNTLGWDSVTLFCLHDSLTCQCNQQIKPNGIYTGPPCEIESPVISNKALCISQTYPSIQWILHITPSKPLLWAVHNSNNRKHTIFNYY